MVIFNGGFDITVGGHTRLDGAVIASTGSADKNHLDTGTLGFSDIGNKEEFDTEHQEAGFSTVADQQCDVNNPINKLYIPEIIPLSESSYNLAKMNNNFSLSNSTISLFIMSKKS